MEEVGGSAVQDLPEGCIAHVISLTCPRDSCRSAATSTAFRSAADSDVVWDRFLSADLGSILDRAVEPVEYATKKELYFRLCDPILLDGGRMSFALDKPTGAKCYMLSARALKIIWGDTSSYWKWLSADDYRSEDSAPSTRFSEVARLVSVCWLEIRGSINKEVLSPNTTYSCYLVFKLSEETYGLGVPSQKASIKIGTQESTHSVLIDPAATRRTRVIFRRRGRNFLGGMLYHHNEEETEETMTGDARVPCSRTDGWMEVEMGEFFVGSGDCGEVEMCFTEVEGGHWKSGLTIQGIEVRPKKN